MENLQRRSSGTYVTRLTIPAHLRVIVGQVIRGKEILSRRGSEGRVGSFLQTWWCLMLTEAVVQEVFDLNHSTGGIGRTSPRL